MLAALRVLVLISVWWLGCSTLAQTTIGIRTAEDDATARLELRNITLPDGSEATLYVVEGSPVTITIDDETIIANYVEFDLETGLVRIVGEGRYISESETVDGRDFTVQLDDTSFQSRNVLISTEQIDVVGAAARRAAGQFDIISGSFSPCGRCQQRINDYGFRAERMRLYPGDRLIAFNVTLLIREHPVLVLPLFIVPLGPVDSQPRLSIRSGTLQQRAQVQLRWPYTVGSDSYGYNELRYYADIIPEQGNIFSNRLLGGKVITQYLGGGLEHRTLFPEGIGLVRFFYTPSFIAYEGGKIDAAPKEKTRDQFQVTLRYDSLEPQALPLDAPQLSLALNRDDAERQRIVTYDFSVRQRSSTELGVLITELSTQGFADLDPSDEVTRPRYYRRGVPLRTAFRLALRPAAESLQLGIVEARNNQLEIAAFEDEPNRTNRSVAGLEVVQAARLLVGSDLTMRELNPWAGMRINATNSFLGKYYSSQNRLYTAQPGASVQAEFERLVDWKTRITLLQSLASYGNLNLDFRRDIQQGETPFAFDNVNQLSRTYLTSSLELRDPGNWISLRLRHEYLFATSRPSERIGPQPLQSSLTLFGNLSWLSLKLSNVYEFQPPRLAELQEPDPGEIEAELTVNVGNANQGGQMRLEVNHVQDLKPESRVPDAPAIPGTPQQLVNDTSKTTASVLLAYHPWLSVSAKTGYRYYPLPSQPSQANDAEQTRLEYWEDLELTATVGTPKDTDNIPSLSLEYARDLNANEPLRFGYTLNVDAQLWGQWVSARMKETYVYEEGKQNTTGNYSLTWRNVLVLEASGFSVVPPTWLGLELEPQLQRQRFELREARSTGNARWRLTYTRKVDPECRGCLNEGEPGIRDSQLDIFANLDAGVWRGLEYYLDTSARWRLADAALDRSYLETLALKAYLEFYDTIALQGTLSYQAVYIMNTQEFSSQRLSLEQVGVTLRLFEQLYIAAVISDVWDLSLTAGDDSPESPYNLQPTFYVIWDRCCWSLYGSWNSASGALRVALGLPGSSKGFVQDIETEIRLPGRPPPQAAAREQ